jgi:DNA-binding LytR/AlgR family response regulator
MRCIIVDDEPLAREGLELKVKQVSFLKLVGTFSGGIKANEYLAAANEVDLIFLDIQMADITGLELLQTLQKPPLVIFTTAYSEYAVTAFALDAVDYLLKPFDFQRFLRSVNKAHEIWHQATRLETKVDDNSIDFIYIRANRQYIKVFLKDIRYIEGMKNYAMIYTTTEKFMTAISLSLILGQLPSTIFTRINKSFIINIQYIDRVLPNSILLDRGKELPFGKAFQDEFIAKFVKNNLLER